MMKKLLCKYIYLGLLGAVATLTIHFMGVHYDILQG